jgi:hypothetical protein
MTEDQQFGGKEKHEHCKRGVHGFFGETMPQDDKGARGLGKGRKQNKKAPDFVRRSEEISEVRWKIAGIPRCAWG